VGGPCLGEKPETVGIVCTLQGNLCPCFAVLPRSTSRRGKTVSHEGVCHQQRVSPKVLPVHFLSAKGTGRDGVAAISDHDCSKLVLSVSGSHPDPMQIFFSERESNLQHSTAATNGMSFLASDCQ
jgi:hypothetical protein